MPCVLKQMPCQVGGIINKQLQEKGTIFPTYCDCAGLGLQKHLRYFLDPTDLEL